MARSWRIRYAGAKYHLTARGNGREAIFLEVADYQRFLEQLRGALEADEVVLYAYVLMPNHYHLLVETPLGNVQRFMQRLNTAYSMYFRYKKARPGHCFQGRYGAKLVEGDDYIIRLTRYIHLNPVKTKRWKDAGPEEKKKALDGYSWSSYRSYAGLEPRREWINYRWLKLMGRITDRGNGSAYRQYISQMIGAEDDVLAKALALSIYAIGDERFISRTDEDIKAARFSKADTGDIVWPEKAKKPIAEVLEAVLAGVGIDLEGLKAHGSAVGDRKMVAIELLCRMSNVTQRGLVSYCGYKREANVGWQRKMFRSRISSDSEFARRFDLLEKRIEKICN